LPRERQNPAICDDGVMAMGAAPMEGLSDQQS